MWRLHDILLDLEKDMRLNNTLTSGTLEVTTSNTCALHMENCKVGTDWLAQNFEVSEDFTLANYQIDPRAKNMLDQPTKVTRTTSIMKHSLIEPINVTNCPKQVHQPEHNHGRTVWKKENMTRQSSAPDAGQWSSWSSRRCSLPSVSS